MEPTIIKGDIYSDNRGNLTFNNNFDLSSIKRIYFIENKNTSIIRAWQGHKIEQRWFSAVIGSFKILLIKIDNWESPTRNLNPQEFILSSKTLDILHVPKGYVSNIQALEESSKLLVMADYLLGKIKDEYKYPQNYFENV
ncbi:WxcM-like domain-containing protein [Lutibacter sp.]|uniref:WxcM-like domain-containing protein n=1 Tax=Lutibacter sp. TaxID=1925666 RepID=UPI0035657BB1